MKQHARGLDGFLEVGGRGSFLKSSWEKEAHFREAPLRSHERIPDQRGCLVDRQRLR
jgi:hypothetical protein